MQHAEFILVIHLDYQQPIFKTYNIDQYANVQYFQGITNQKTNTKQLPL